MPSGVNNLRKLGVAPFLEKYPYHLFKGIRYVSAKGSVAEANFAEVCGGGVFSELSYLPHYLNVPKLYQILKYKKGLL